MRFRSRLLGAFAFLYFTAPVAAQPAKVDHAASLEYSRIGFEFEQKKEYKYALFEYDTAAKLDPTYAYPVERIGGMYQELKNYPKAIDAYEHAIQLDSMFDVYEYYNLGLSFHVVQKFDSAVHALREFIARMDPVNKADSAAMIDADWWIKFNLGCIVEFAKPKNTEDPISLNEINSKFDDFAPTETADGNTLFFTSTRPGTNEKEEIETKDYGEDLFMTHRDTLGHWTKPEPLPPPLNSVDDEGSAFVTADGQTMYISLCRRPDGMGDCDVYVSHLVGDIWTKPQPLGHPLNSTAWDANPSVTADGETMYFSSRRRGSIDGSEDIYVSYKNTDGSWSVPSNLGEPINTRFNERSPFISADGKTLYFSSNGHPGFGNHDLFMSRKLDDGTWSVPVNLGRPINAYGDDVFLTIPASGDKIIYSSQRTDARAPLSLYEAKLPLEFRPGPVTLVEGVVYDRETLQPIGGEVDVNDLKTDKLVATYHANKITGKFYITLRTGKEYGVTATASGYAPFSDHYTVPDTISYTEVTHDLPLTKLPNYAAIHTIDSAKDYHDSLLAANTEKSYQNTGGNLHGSGNNTGGADTNGDWMRNHHPGRDTTSSGMRHHNPGRDTTGDWMRNNLGRDTTGDWMRNNLGHDTTGDWMKHLHTGSDTTGDWMRNHHPERDTTGDWMRNHHPGRDTTGDWMRNHHPGRDTTGDWMRNHHPGRDTTGDWMRNHHPGRDTTGDWMKHHHPGRDTTGDWMKHHHPGRDTTGNWARNHQSIDTSGVELHNVFFDFDKSTLRTESHSELNYWIDLLKKYPVLKIEIDGHTDSVGTAQYNLRLSLARAEAVKAYLVAHGVKAKQLVPKGFGATKPKAPNDTDEGRQRNRRTEFRFIKS